MAFGYFVGVWLLVVAVAMVTGMYWNSPVVRKNLTALKAFGYASMFAFDAMPIIAIVYHAQLRWYETFAAWLIGLVLGSPFVYGIIMVVSQNTAQDDWLEINEKGLVWNMLWRVICAFDRLTSDTSQSVSDTLDLNNKSLCSNGWFMMLVSRLFPIILLVVLLVTAIIKTIKIFTVIIGLAFGWYIHWDRKLFVDWKNNFPDGEFTSLWKKRFCPIQPILVLFTAMLSMRIRHMPASAEEFTDTAIFLVFFAVALGTNLLLVTNTWVARYLERKERDKQERIARQVAPAQPRSRTYDRVVRIVVAPTMLCDRKLTSLHTHANAFADDAKQRCTTFWRAILDFKQRACPTVRI